MLSTQITFDLPDTESEIEFLQRYMVPAWSRFEARDAFESGWFWPARNFARHEIPELTRGKHDLERLERGMIVFVINGDPDAVIETERRYWREFEADGLLTDWERQSYRPTYRNSREKMRDKYGPVGGDRTFVLRSVAAEVTIDCLEAFDEPLPAVGESNDENPAPVGFWTMTHFLMKQQGYDWYDEIDACTKAIENRLRSLSTFLGEDAAREELATVLAELETVDLET